MNGIENKLQTLIQQLSSTNTPSTSGTTDTTTSNLQQDFQSLLSAFGASGSNASLSNFLQAISDNLKGANPGLNVSTSA